MTTHHGLIRWLETEARTYKDHRIGLVCNATSVDLDFNHSIQRFLNHPDIRLTTVFGPQHGLFGETQDNMVEWQSVVDSNLGIPIYSLYGTTRMPTPEMFHNVDIIVFDIQDIGSRYYTFIYTMASVMAACVRDQKKMIILDRPNPLNGVDIEGNLLQSEFTSFVGMYPILIRHGMTIGELARMFNHAFGIGCDMEIIPMENWSRTMWFDETGLPWILPSPNMPTLDTAIVYPGMCLLEGTNLSEGRGTTRPFEIFGAPFIHAQHLRDYLSHQHLPGVKFRAVRFLPTFQKWEGHLCEGIQVHVTDRRCFSSIHLALMIFQYMHDHHPEEFKWRQPPYEYEYQKWPIDILSGSSSLRLHIDESRSLDQLFAAWKQDESVFREMRKPYLIYD